MTLMTKYGLGLIIALTVILSGCCLSVDCPPPPIFEFTIVDSDNNNLIESDSIEIEDIQISNVYPSKIWDSGQCILVDFDLNTGDYNMRIGDSVKVDLKVQFFVEDGGCCSQTSIIVYVNGNLTRRNSDGCYSIQI